MNTNLDGYPLFRCNRAMFAYWASAGILRRQLASTISKTWKTGVIILTPRLYAVGMVAPNGTTQDLKPPYRQFKMWQICNQPSVRYKQCACRMFYDPESGGAWGERDDVRGKEQHHPHCQFDRRAVPAWKEDARNALARVERGEKPQARPDEWIRTREAIS